MKRFLLMGVCFFGDVANASVQEYARQLSQQAQQTAQHTSPGVVPGFQTDFPVEVTFNDPTALEASRDRTFAANETAAHVKKSAETRPYFRLDLEKDPIVRGAQVAITNPEVFLSGDFEEMQGGEFVVRKCIEAKPPKEFMCVKELLPPVFHVDPAKYSHHWCARGNHRPDDPQCTAKKYYNPARLYESEKIHVQPEVWTSTCQELEEQERRGHVCRLIKQICPKGPETREIMGTMNGQPTARQITRPCWLYELTYACAYPSQNTCAGLREQGCAQMGSKSLTKGGEICVEWEQTFKCPVGADSKRKICRTPLRLESSPSVESEGSNHDLNEAISKLSILQEIQANLRASGTTTVLPQIFKGLDRRCTIAFAGFKNCCTDGRGWGVSLGLSGCGAEEKDLAEREHKGLCHEIGTYCAEKILGVCTRKKRSFCCFPSKLSRILHEQGRAQLGISWGEAEDPQCRGFTEQEIARINFDQLDLREVFAEVTSRVRQQTAQVVQRNLSSNVSQMTQSFKNKAGDQ